MKRSTLSTNMVVLYTVAMTIFFSGVLCVSAANALNPLDYGEVRLDRMAPVLKNDPVGAPLLEALLDHKIFFVKFRGGTPSEETSDFWINDLQRRETARQEGKYAEEVELIIKENIAKGWFNNERAELFRKLYMQPAMVKFDQRGVIAGIKRTKELGAAAKNYDLKGLPDAPKTIQPYKIGNVNENTQNNLTNPTIKNKAGIIQFALPIPKGSKGADHIRRILASAFTEDNGWKAMTPDTLMEGYKELQELNNKLPQASRMDMNAQHPEKLYYNFKHMFGASNMRFDTKINAAEMVSVTFEDLFDDMGFIWVYISYIKPQQ